MMGAKLAALLLLLLPSFSLSVAAKKDGNEHEHANEVPSKPNFVIVLTDDLDWTLGGARASTLARTRNLVGGEGMDGRGTTLENWFVQTPVCCSSRSELLTGRMYHNLKKPTAHSAKGCMHVDVENDPHHAFYDDWYFANYFGVQPESTAANTNTTASNTTTANPYSLNYKVGIFGKHLNTHNPSNFLPKGVDEMLINGGGAYLNPAFTYGRKTQVKRGNTSYLEDVVEEVTFKNCTKTTGMPCYSTSVIGNASLAWIQRQVDEGDGNPFLALISVKAPHIQDGNGFPLSIPAPWYRDTVIPEATAPRTPNYNATGPPHSHHWLVDSQLPLTPLQASKVDDLYVSRLKTLMSVDDLVHDLVQTLEELHVLEDTYIFFTSDNGYRLGQFRMPCCKLHPYENDVRVPMMIRGPGIGNQRTSSSDGNKRRNRRNRPSTPTTPDQRAIFSHVHLMPTLMGLATGDLDSQDMIPATMDGTNLARWLLDDDYEDDDYEDGDTSAKETEQRHNVRHGASSSAIQSVEAEATAAVSSSSTNSISLLIEYTSLGDVVRYQHLIDTYNHSFVALRIMPTEVAVATAAATAEHRTSTDSGSNHKKSFNNNNTTIIESISNLKYVEFRDCRVDWTNQEGPPLQRELYDLDADPYELDNLLAVPTGRISPKLLHALEQKTQRLIACRGEECRTEHSTGLDDWNHEGSTSSSAFPLREE